MSWDSWIPLLVIASSLLPGLIIFGLAEERVRLRTTLNLLGAVSKLALVGLMLWGVFHEHHYETRLALLPGLELVLRAGPLALLFVTLSTVLWLLTTVYAIGYLEGSPHRSRFFGFFSLCVTATVGVALAGNLITFVLFYELLTLSTYPLVVHRGTEVARRAGQTYLIYTVVGGALLLLGTAWLYTLTGNLEFTPRGFVGHLGPEHGPVLVIIFALLIAGLGVKAALVPLHGWLPQAMVAPAPVSALLHAVAVVKAGAFGIVRVVYDVYGVEFAAGLGVTQPLAMAGGIHHHLRFDARLVSGRSETQTGVFDRQSGVVHRAGRGHCRSHRHHRWHRASGASGADEDHPVLLRGQSGRNPRHSQDQRDERRRPAHALDHGGIHRRRLRYDRRAADRRVYQQVVSRPGCIGDGPGMGDPGAGWQQSAQCRLFPAHSAPRLVPGAAR